LAYSSDAAFHPALARQLSSYRESFLLNARTAVVSAWVTPKYRARKEGSLKTIPLGSGILKFCSPSPSGLLIRLAAYHAFRQGYPELAQFKPLWLVPLACRLQGAGCKRQSIEVL
jgi:hypothetical protein